MKYILLILLSLNLTYITGQVADPSSSMLCPITITPKWKHGTNEELQKDIIRYIKYPNEQCIEGVTILQFKVDTFGQVKVPQIIRSLSEEIDKQLLSIILNYEFEPAILQYKKVEHFITLPIKIKLE